MDLSIENLSTKLPFILGVTGHRDIISDTNNDQRLDLKAKTRTTILHWYHKLNVTPSPEQTPSSIDKAITPIWLMSGIAEGADLLVIEVALELQSELGSDAIKIIGCLPMPLTYFEQDFEPDSAAYQQLKKVVSALQSNENEMLVIKHALAENDYQAAINDQTYGEIRSSLYLNQGLFIAKYANVLLALWDGCEAKGVGGTADVVKYKLGMEVHWPNNTENLSLKAVSEFDGQIAGLVHHLVVRRFNSSIDMPQLALTKGADNNSLDAIKPDVGELYAYSYEGNDNALTHFISTEFINLLSELNFYNRLSAAEGEIETTLEKNELADNGLTAANPIFHAADNLALKGQLTYRKLIKLFFWFAIIGFSFYELAGNFINSEEGSWVISITLISIFTCWGVIRYAGKNELKWKYQLSRGIAEGMRIRGFLNLSNIPPSGEPIIPRRYRSHLPLLNHAIAIAEIDWWRKDHDKNLNKIRDTWINDQCGFFQSRLQLSAKSFSEFLYKRPRYAAQVCASFSKRCFILAISVGALLLCSMLYQQLFKTSNLNDINNIFMLIVQYSLMLGGVVALWSELSGYETSANGYDSMEELYSRAQFLLKGNMTKSKELMLLALAREAMFEHVSWTSSESNSDIKNRK